MTTLNLGKNYGTAEYKCSGVYYADLAPAQAASVAIWAGGVACSADRIVCDNNCGGLTDFSLIRIGVTDVPAGSTVTDATMFLKTKYGMPTGTRIISCRQVKTGNWGPDNTTTGTGIWENTATHGQVTSRRRVDYNGAGGDKAWAGTYFAIAADCSPATQNFSGTLVTNTFYGIPCTQEVKNWVENGQSNWGVCLWSDSTGQQEYFWGDCTGANAPYLAVGYSSATASNVVVNCMGSTL